MLDHKFLLFNGSLLTSDHRRTKDVTEAIMQPLQSNTPLKDLSGKGDGQGLGTQTMEAIGRPHFMPAMEELARGAHDFEWASCYGAKRQH